jgi:hypothetical protein
MSDYHGVSQAGISLGPLRMRKALASADTWAFLTWLSGAFFTERLEELSVQARHGWAPLSRWQGPSPYVSPQLLPQLPPSSNAWSSPANVAWRTSKVRPAPIAYSPRQTVIDSL